MKLCAIRNGWAAIGQGWAVHGRTKEEAQDNFAQSKALHKLIEARTRDRIARAQTGEQTQGGADGTTPHMINLI